MSPEPDLAAMPLMEHIRELRSRLIKSILAVFVGTAAGLLVARPIIGGLQSMCDRCEYIFYRPTEAFGSYFRVALVVGLIIALPVVLYQVVAFIVPGLHKHERRYLYLMIPGAALLFGLGLLFGYFVVTPRATSFLASVLEEFAAPMWSLGVYIAFVTNLLLIIGLTFQLPLVVFALSKVGIATPERLARYRRHVILLIAVAAAVLTPTPDPVTMLLVMLPMVALYEVGILLAKAF